MRTWKSSTTLGAAVMFTAVLWAGPQASGDAPIAIAVGEMAAPSAGPEAAQALSEALERAVVARGDLRFAADARRARYVLRGSVVELEQHPVPDGLEVRCAVSLIVADARGGAVRAMLTGRAGARGIDDPETLTAAALAAAVRGAIHPLGTSVR